MMVIKLEPKFDSRQSFGGKATIHFEGKKMILKSYATDVAWIEGRQAHVNGLYSETTTRHIKEFLKQNGFEADSSEQILRDYGDK